MNILRKLTRADLKLNKKRTIGILVGIVLATALITVVGGMFAVLQNTLVQETIDSSGYYHIVLNDLTVDEVKNVSLNKDFSNVEVVKHVGDTASYLENDNYISASIYSMNLDSFNYLKYELIDGIFPRNDSEILITKLYAKRLNIEIGDTISIPIVDADTTDDDMSLLFESALRDYKVVGITSGFYNLITTQAPNNNCDVYLTLKNPRNYKKDLSELLGVDNYKSQDNAKYSYSINGELLRWEVYDFSDNVLGMLTSLVAIIMTIILATSVFSIRNSFAISTNEKLKIYGMLSSVGATKKQIRKMVLFEGFYLGIIGITLGLLLGGFVTYLLTWLINFLAVSANIVSNGGMLYYKFAWYPFIIATIVDIVMIYLSTLSSSIKASLVTPIQNIRNSDNIKNPRKLKVPFIIKKLFKVGGSLSYKNLKRSKKKYRVTVVSLTVSILVFIVAFSFLDYGIREVNNEFTNLDYDVEVSDGGRENGFDGIDVDALISLDKAHLRYYLDSPYMLYDVSHITNYDSKLSTCDSYDEDYNCLGKTIYYVPNNNIFYDDESFKELCSKLKLDYNYMKDKMIVLDNAIINRKEIRISNYKKGDVITLTDRTKGKTLTYTVGAISDIRPWGYEVNYSDGIKFVMNEKYYKGSETLELDTIYYKTNDATALVDNIENITDEVYIQNLTELAKQMKTMILIFSIFIYGFIIVVTLIGITSVFNTINSNMELRRREFATLKSIGMTKYEFNNMIMLESIFYSIKSLFFGIILGILGSYFVYSAFKANVDFGYLFPIRAIIIAIIFIIILVYTIMKYSISKLNKENIIETIRKENI